MTADALVPSPRRLAMQDGAIALTGLLATLLLLGVMVPVLLGTVDVLATSQRAQVAADAAALALIGESPAARLPEVLRTAEPPTPTAAGGPQGAEPAEPGASPPTSTVIPGVVAPSAAAIALARAVADANGAVLVEIDVAGWPTSVLVTVRAHRTGIASALWDGIDARAAATLRADPHDR